MARKPITPAEALGKSGENIPDFVIEAFDELITEGIRGSTSVTITQDEAVERIISKMPARIADNLGHSRRDEIFEKNWLDVEELYREQGWEVQYDKPAYNESYAPTFTFSSKAR